MRGWALTCLAILLLSGCSEPARLVEVPDQSEPDNFERKDEGDDGVTIEVEQKERTDPDVPIQPELYVTVREPGGLPLSAANIDILGTDRFRKTDENGTAHFPNMTAGKLQVRVTPAESWYKIVEVNVMVHSDAITRVTVEVPVAEGFLTPPHRHDDAWVRGDEVHLFDLAWDVDCAGFTAVCQGSDVRGRVPVEKPFGAPVPPGTGQLRLTTMYESPTGSGLGLTLHGPDFAVKSASFDASGDAAIVELDPDEADAPHALTSAWTMQITVATTTYQGVWLGPITVSVTALRGDFDLPLDPPHPDLWGEETRLRLADQTYSAASIRNPHSPAQHDAVLDMQGSFGFRRMDEGAIVIPGTSVVEVRAWVNHTATWPWDMVLEIDPLGQDGTDGWPVHQRRYMAASQEGVFWEYWVEADSSWYDALYDERSKWRFRLLPEYDPVTQTSVVSMDVHVVIDLYRHDPR